MQSSTISFKGTAQNVSKKLQNTGAKVTNAFSKGTQGFDKYLSSKGKDINKIKQTGIGAFFTVISLAAAIITLKNLIHKIKEKIEEK